MSASDPNKDGRKLYLDHIEIHGIKKWKFRVKLRLKNENADKNIELEEHEHRWTPLNSCEVPATGGMSVILKAGVAVGGFGLGKQETMIDISGQRISEEFLKLSGQRNIQGSSNAPNSSFSIAENITFGDHSVTANLIFHPSQTSETARQALNEVKVAMEDYSRLKAKKTMRSVDTALKLGLAASEVNPYAKGAFSIARATYDLLNEQQKYDEQVSDLVDRIEKILAFSKRVEEVSYDDTSLITKAMEQMNDLIVDTANFAYAYVQQGFLRRFARSAISPTDRRRLDELRTQLDNLIGEFNRAIEFEGLKVTKDIDTKLLLKRLKPVDAGYNCKRKCMEGTRQRLINKIVTWALPPSGVTPLRKQSAIKSILWIYGMPGIGKTSVANSICARFHAEKRLGGSFFCRRDDPKLGDPVYVLPTLTCQLAEMWGPFRKLVAEELSMDPQITPKSTGSALLPKLLKLLENHPPHPLVLVIDALDECGDDRAREMILRRAFDAASCVSWLKIVITSRQEADINEFFEQPDRYGRYLLEDLSTDDKAHEDIRHFTQKRLSSIAAARHLTDWAPEHLVNKVVLRASGLYIFVDTLWRLVREDPDPEIYLNQILEGSTGDASGDLYSLYSSILSSRVKRDHLGFKAVMGAILVVGSYRPLCARTIAILVGRQASMVQTLVGNMSSLLYRDSRQHDGIRFRHLSIISFLTSPSCPEEFRVDIQQAHREMAVACLNTMINGLKFNICKLKSSLLSNEEVKDMDDRIKENISDELQYSCMHWSSHLSLSPYSARSDIMGILDKLFEDVQPLYWMEVLSLMDKAPIGIGMLRGVLRWAKGMKSPALEYADDALRFLQAFLAPITTSTPHIYVSALPFTPVESILWKKASKFFQNLMRVERGRTERWPARPSAWNGHISRINSVAYHPDGLRLVSGSSDMTVRIWDAETGAPIGEPLKGHTNAVESVAYSPDSQYVISGSRDCTIRIWDAETGASVGEPLEGHTNIVSSVVYSPDGRHIVSGSWDYTIRIWDARSRAPVGEPLKGHTHRVASVAYSPNGRHLVSSSWDETIRIWDVNNGAPVGEPSMGLTSRLGSVVYSPDSRHIIPGFFNSAIRTRNTETGNPIPEILEGDPSWARSVAYSPDSRHIVSGCNSGVIQIWDVATGAPVGGLLKGHTKRVNSVAYSPDGRHVVSGSSDKTIRIWDVETGALVDGRYIVSAGDNTIQVWNADTGTPAGESLKTHTERIFAVAYSPNGLHVVSSSEDNTIRIWDAQTGAPVGEPLKGHTDDVNSIACSPDGRYIVSGSRDNTIRIWDAETGAPVGEPLKGHTHYVLSGAYSPDGRHIVSGSFDKTIRIWEVETGASAGEPLVGHTHSVYCVSYSPDGRHVVSGSSDNMIRIWEVKTGASVGEPLEGHTNSVYSVAYSPDGLNVVSGSADDTIRIWDVETGAQVGEPLKGHTNDVLSVAYSPDGRHVISSSCDYTIRIWDVEARALVGEPLKGHTDFVWSVAYSPDGRHVSSGSSDKTVRIWDANTAAPGADSMIQVFNTEITGNAILLDLRPDQSGWVRHPSGGLLFWIPESCRSGLTCAATLTIPTDGYSRVVRLDPSGACFGASWEQIKD
ncbi:hypothetical protein FRB91_004806 [Serendipita sp. 411]|nr:hypothetical protein FRB91_004806 [Serendipita sp. 411]